MDISATAASMPRSGIREIMDLAATIEDVIHLEVGQPNFPTPRHITEAAHEAALAGHTTYAPNPGIPALREAVASKVERVNGYKATPEQVVVCNGAVQGLFAIMRLLLDPGDEILMPNPAWPNYGMMITLAGGTIRTYEVTSEGGYLPAPAQLEQLTTDRTRVLLLNSPSNPLGAVIPEPLLQELLAFAERHDLWVVSDEAYDQITFDEGFRSAAAVRPESDRIFSVYTCSKTYAMTGWRVGYVVAPPAAAETLSKMQEAIVSSVNAPAQHAAVAALTGPQDIVAQMRSEYHERRDLAVAELAGADVEFVRPSGAFYLWVRAVPAGQSSADFSKDLVRNQQVAVVPGSAFGSAGDDAVRVSLATSTDQLLEGVRRLAKAARR